MTIDYQEQKEIIVAKEKELKKPFVGYISPSGNLISFNNKNNSNLHYDWENVVSEAFLRFISFIVKSGDDEYKTIRGLYGEEKTLEEFIDELDQYIQEKYTGDNLLEFRHNLLLCLRNAYMGKSFFESIGKGATMVDQELFHKHYNSDFKLDYEDYVKKILMNNFKDISVMYLGYDSLEKIGIDNEIIVVPDNPDLIEPFFDETPRIITTSHSDVNDRFFNHLLMEWKINKVPRYYWNENKLKYEEEFFDSSFAHNEEGLEKEISSIKRLVPLKDRYKYFK